MAPANNIMNALPTRLNRRLIPEQRCRGDAHQPQPCRRCRRNNLQYQSPRSTCSPSIPVSTNQTRLPVISALPAAAFVNGDTGLKQTTEVNWANKFINIEELAAIVPIPEAVLDDTAFDVWGSVQPLLEQAIGRALDAAVLFGVNKPASWPSDINTAAVAASNTRVRGTATPANGGIAEDFNQLFAKVEGDGFYVERRRRADELQVAAARRA
jgi:HK97 family phage major capsid protein